MRTIMEWTKTRVIPSYKVGHFRYYDPDLVAAHIRKKLKIEARG